MKTFKELVNDFDAVRVLMENNYMPIDAVNSMFSKMGRSNVSQYFHIPTPSGKQCLDSMDDYNGNVYADYNGNRILYLIFVTAEIHTPNRFIFYVEDPVFRKKLSYKLRKIKHALELCNKDKENKFETYSKTFKGSKLRAQLALQSVVGYIERAMDRQYLLVTKSTPSNLIGESNFIFQHFNTRQIIRATICPEKLELDIYAEDAKVHAELLDRLNRLTNIHELMEAHNMCRTVKALQG